MSFPGTAFAEQPDNALISNGLDNLQRHARSYGRLLLAAGRASEFAVTGHRPSLDTPRIDRAVVDGSLGQNVPLTASEPGPSQSAARGPFSWLGVHTSNVTPTAALTPPTMNPTIERVRIVL